MELIKSVNPKEILLDNILAALEYYNVTFGKDLSSDILGGEDKLLGLIAAGKIDAQKKSNAQNSKWHCPAAQVLRHCRNMRSKNL